MATVASLIAPPSGIGQVVDVFDRHHRYAKRFYLRFLNYQKEPRILWFDVCCLVTERRFRSIPPNTSIDRCHI